MDWSTFDGPLAAAAFILYVILSAPIKLIGYLAASRNEIIDWRKFLTPSPTSYSYLGLAAVLDFGAVTVWSVFIILFRELLVSALRMARAAGVVVAADKLGKYKTATTMVSICGYLCVFAMAGFAPWSGGADARHLPVSRFLYAVAVVLTVISGAQYFELPQDRLFDPRSWIGMTDSFEQISAHNEELARDIVERERSGRDGFDG